MEVKKIKSVLKAKSPQVKDPVRYPKVIEPIELIAKKNYHLTLQKTIGDVVKHMVDLKK